MTYSKAIHERALIVRHIEKNCGGLRHRETLVDGIRRLTRPAAKHPGSVAMDHGDSPAPTKKAAAAKKKPTS